MGRAFAPPLLLCGAVELVITPRVIHHVIADQGLQPRLWGDSLQRSLNGWLPSWLRNHDDSGRLKKEDAKASIALIPQTVRRSSGAEALV